MPGPDDQNDNGLGDVLRQASGDDAASKKKQNEHDEMLRKLAENSDVQRKLAESQNIQLDDDVILRDMREAIDADFWAQPEKQYELLASKLKGDKIRQGIQNPGLQMALDGPLNSKEVRHYKEIQESRSRQADEHLMDTLNKNVADAHRKFLETGDESELVDAKGKKKQWLQRIEEFREYGILRNESPIKCQDNIQDRFAQNAIDHYNEKIIEAYKEAKKDPSKKAANDNLIKNLEMEKQEKVEDLQKDKKEKYGASAKWNVSDNIVELKKEADKSLEKKENIAPGAPHEVAKLFQGMQEQPEKSASPTPLTPKK